MPPRLHLRRGQGLQTSTSSTSTSLPTFLVPFLSQSRNAHILASLSDTPGAYNKRIRRGRGPSSGKGKTSGRGHKGQKQHSKAPTAFNGGQTSDEVVHGKHGMKNLFSPEMSPCNLDQIQIWIDNQRLDPTRPITLRELCKSRVLHGIKDGVKLLARGSEVIKQPIHLVVSKASKSAISAVEKAGGTVTTRFYTKDSIRRILGGKTHPWLSMRWDGPAIFADAKAKAVAEAQALAASSPDGRVRTTINPAFAKLGMGADPLERVRGGGFEFRLPDPTSRKDIEYYRDPEKRGYLSHLLAAGEGPSLYHRMPPSEEEIKRLRALKGVTKTEKVEGERLW